MSNNNDYILDLKNAVELANQAFANCRIKPTSAIISEELTEMYEQNKKIIKTLQKNNEQLVKLVETKEKELDEAKKEAKKAKIYNTWMMIITILSMFAAMASWIIPLIITD